MLSLEWPHRSNSNKYTKYTIFNINTKSILNYLKSAAMRFVFHGTRGWLGGAKVLGKLSVPGRPTSLDYSRARAYCACRRCGWGLVWTFFLSSSFSRFFLTLFGRRPDID